MAAAYMVEYFHRNEERVSEQRKRSYQRASVAEKEQRRLQRRERRQQAKLQLPEEQRRGRGRPKSITRMGLKPEELEADAVLRGIAQQRFPLNETSSLTTTPKQWHVCVKQGTQPT